jgi:hypothetical protein
VELADHHRKKQEKPFVINARKVVINQTMVPRLVWIAYPVNTNRTLNKVIAWTVELADHHRKKHEKPFVTIARKAVINQTMVPRHAWTAYPVNTKISLEQTGASTVKQVRFQ